MFGGKAAAEFLPHLLSLLDGKRTLSEIHGAFDPSLEGAVDAALSGLNANRLLLDGSLLDLEHRDDPDAALFFEANVYGGEGIADARRILRESVVGLIGNSSVAAEAARLLREGGVGRLITMDWNAGEDELAQTHAIVALPSNDETPLLRSFNERAVRARATWVPVLPYDGQSLVVGPWIVPGDTACFACYELRRGAASGYADEYDVVHASPANLPGFSSLDACAAGALTMQVFAWLLRRDPNLPGRFLAFEFASGFATSTHDVLKVPRCSVCSIAGRRGSPMPWHE